MFTLRFYDNNTRPTGQVFLGKQTSSLALKPVDTSSPSERWQIQLDEVHILRGKENEANFATNLTTSQNRYAGIFGAVINIIRMVTFFQFDLAVPAAKYTSQEICQI